MLSSLKSRVAYLEEQLAGERKVLTEQRKEAAKQLAEETNKLAEERKKTARVPYLEEELSEIKVKLAGEREMRIRAETRVKELQIQLMSVNNAANSPKESDARISSLFCFTQHLVEYCAVSIWFV